jgi:hypothetical protein
LNSEDLLEIGTDCFKFQTVWVCWFFGKNHSNFVLSLIKTLQSYYIGNKVCSEIKETTIWAGHFTAILLPTTVISFTKLWFRKLFWGAYQDWILCEPKATTKLQKILMTVFFDFGRKKNRKYKFQNGHFWPFVVFFFWQLYSYLSQNWDSDGHFEVLSVSKP